MNRPAKQRNGRGRFTKPEAAKAAPTPPKRKIKPPREVEDAGDDMEEIEILRIDNVSTVTARNQSGRVVKAFVRDSMLYRVGMRRDFRVAKNGAYHEIDPPPPIKRRVTYEEYIGKK